jgi:DNA-binding response OmpR family regulator
MEQKEIVKDPIFEGKKVMIVDDSKMMLLMYSQVFEKVGASIILCSDGLEAVGLAKKHGPDIIILDFILPEVIGGEICREMKKDDEIKEIPIVMLTGHEDEKYIIECIDSGADDYLFKRSVPKVIISKVKTLLEKVELKKQVAELTQLAQSTKALKGMDEALMEMIAILSGKKTRFREFLKEHDGEEAKDFKQAVLMLLKNVKEIKKAEMGYKPDSV